MIVGESGVGKTSLREAYLEGGALDHKGSFQMATQVTDSREKSITIEEDDLQVVELLELIDTRGDNHFNQSTDYT